MKPASFLKRVAASVLDFMISSFFSVIWILLVFTLLNTLQIAIFSWPGWLKWPIIAMSYLISCCISLVPFWAYFASFESSKWMATPGKMILGLKVSDLYGKPLNMKKASLRFIFKSLSTIILGIGHLMMVGNIQKQTLHDSLAGTLVWDENTQADLKDFSESSLEEILEIDD